MGEKGGRIWSAVMFEVAVRTAMRTRYRPFSKTRRPKQHTLYKYLYKTPYKKRCKRMCTHTHKIIPARSAAVAATYPARPPLQLLPLLLLPNTAVVVAVADDVVAAVGGGDVAPAAAGDDIDGRQPALESALALALAGRRRASSYRLGAEAEHRRLRHRRVPGLAHPPNYRPRPTGPTATGKKEQIPISRDTEDQPWLRLYTLEMNSCTEVCSTPSMLRNVFQVTNYWIFNFRGRLNKK